MNVLISEMIGEINHRDQSAQRPGHGSVSRLRVATGHAPPQKKNMQQNCRCCADFFWCWRAQTSAPVRVNRGTPSWHWKFT